MAEQVIYWKDSRGLHHASEALADEASRQYERGDKRRSVLKHFEALIGDTVPPECRRHAAIAFSRDYEVAEWLIQNWPAIKAIGYAYRLDDLAPPAKE